MIAHPAASQAGHVSRTRVQPCANGLNEPIVGRHEFDLRLFKLLDTCDSTDYLHRGGFLHHPPTHIVPPRASLTSTEEPGGHVSSIHEAAQ